MSGDLSNPALNVSDMRQEQTLQNIQQLQNWMYDPLNESKRIASIIKKRILEENI